MSLGLRPRSGGDPLADGCGRLFEGNHPRRCAHSLAKLAASAIPAPTAPHEYTLSNIRFAEAVEPGNAKLKARKVRDAGLRTRNLPTVPFTIADELDTNPFLRLGLARGRRLGIEARRAPALLARRGVRCGARMEEQLPLEK